MAANLSGDHAVMGGMFGLEPATAAQTSQGSIFPASATTLFLSARCAIYVASRLLKPHTVWLPSYLCVALLEPFLKPAIPIRFYDDTPNSSPHSQEWAAKVAAGDLVVAIHYFGFPNKAFPARQLRHQGAVILEDASQALFLKQEYPDSVCIVHSPRKFLGVPDGGVMVSERFRSLSLRSLEAPPTPWWTDALAAAQMRREFDRLGGENKWFRLFQAVEATVPLGAYRSSDLARAVIESADYESIRRTRRENYLALLAQLKPFAVFQTLDDETVPLGFPVLVDAAHRDAVLSYLYKEKIFPPIHWRIAGIVPDEHEESHRVSNSILTLICDQRYDLSDMARQAELFLSAVEQRMEAKRNC